MDTYELVDIFMNLDDNERAKFRARRKYLQDEEHNKAVLAKEIAKERAKGVAEGIREGREEGKLKKKYEIARNLLRLNMPVEHISAATGLSKIDIYSLSVH